jgi:hypothetical protein
MTIDPDDQIMPGRLDRGIEGIRLDQDHSARLGGDLRPQRLDAQPRRRADGHGGVLPRRRGISEGRGLTGDRHLGRPPDRWRAVVFRRPEPGGDSRRGRAKAPPSAANPVVTAACAGSLRRHRRSASHPERQEMRGAGQEDPRRCPPEQAVSPDALRNPGALTPFIMLSSMQIGTLFGRRLQPRPVVHISSAGYPSSSTSTRSVSMNLWPYPPTT